MTANHMGVLLAICTAFASPKLIAENSGTTETEPSYEFCDWNEGEIMAQVIWSERTLSPSGSQRQFFLRQRTRNQRSEPKLKADKSGGHRATRGGENIHAVGESDIVAEIHGQTLRVSIHLKYDLSRNGADSKVDESVEVETSIGRHAPSRSRNEIDIEIKWWRFENTN